MIQEASNGILLFSLAVIAFWFYSLYRAISNSTTAKIEPDSIHGNREVIDQHNGNNGNKNREWTYYKDGTGWYEESTYVENGRLALRLGKPFDWKMGTSGYQIAWR